MKRASSLIRQVQRPLSTNQHAFRKAVDVHTHVYLPGYMKMLRQRQDVPRVIPGAQGEERLVILPGEDEEASTAAGRPIGDEYWSIDRKLKYMDRHGIDISVLSLANPWLDFLNAEEAKVMAKELNEEMQSICDDSNGRLYGFGVCPAHAGGDAAAEELVRISKQDKLRGIILGTHGVGNGLDDPELLPLFQEAERLELTIFLHPHYGVGNEHFGGAGHALFLALGFPFETTVAVSRLIVSGVMDKCPNLKLLLAHGGGVLPFLGGRLDSCVMSDPALAGKLQYAPTEYLRRMYYDSVVYHTPSLTNCIELVGADQLMFGTDNPFFPPPEGAQSDAEWASTVKNYYITDELSARDQERILRGNASSLLDIPLLSPVRF